MGNEHSMGSWNVLCLYGRAGNPSWKFPAKKVLKTAFMAVHPFADGSVQGAVMPGTKGYIKA